MQLRFIIFMNLFIILSNIVGDADINDRTQPIYYYSNAEKTTDQALMYSTTQQSLWRYLAFRDIPSLINAYVQGKKTLDYGVGAGNSVKFLQGLGLDIMGVDISKEMLQQASINCPDAPFYLIKNGLIPIPDEYFDFVFSSFVLFSFGSEHEMVMYLNEAKRVLKKNGILIAITGSQYAYSHDWLVINTDFQENKNLKSGDLGKAYLSDIGMMFFDYYWTEEDYRSFFEKAGFKILEIHYPLAKEHEEYPWKDEKTHSPYLTIVATIL